VLKGLANLLRRRRVATAEELREFLAAEAAYLSQKSTIDYCRARAGFGWQKLTSEATFLAALEACRWQAMAAVLSDMILVTEGFLRPHAGKDLPRLAEGLGAVFHLILEHAPAPESARAAWPSLIEETRARLARAQLGSVHNPGDIAKVSGARIFELLPIHPSVRQHDREVVVNNIRFGMVAFSETLARAVETPAELARRVAAAAPAPP
jgi:hypothetical protein